MKFKFIHILALGLVTTVTACSQPHKVYWKRADDNSALYLTGSKAIARLDEDVSFCTYKVEKMVELNALHETMPPDTTHISGRTDALAYYDTPTRLGAAKTSHTDLHDFEGCMLSRGWMRQNYIRPQIAMKDDKNYREIQSVRQTGMTVQQKQWKKAAAIRAYIDSLSRYGERFKIGIQTYKDTYDEPSLNVETSTDFYGITATYINRNSAHNFWTLEGRLARGEADYDSPSGILNGIPEYEGDIRLTYGKDYPLDDGWISLYIGLGTRIYRMHGKGLVTDLGAWFYDRRIEQLYLPLGVTWRSLFGTCTVSSNLEFDPLLAGRVNSRLTNGGGPNVVNDQKLFSGYGVRGEIMIGIPMEAQTIEFGPFFRYWDIGDSEIEVIPPFAYWEPSNTRSQYGMEARVSF